MPEKMGRTQEPFLGRRIPESGLSFLLTVFLSLWMIPGRSNASDGATEALELRLHAELSIAEEQAGGHKELANAMTEALPGLLLEYLASRDETIALDVVDAAFVREQIKIAELMQEPGLALALDVFAGPGTGYEHGLLTALANLADNEHGKASEVVLGVYERQIERRQEHVEEIEEIHRKVGEHRLEAQLSAADRLERKAEQIAGNANEKAAKGLEKAAEQIEQAAEKIEQVAEKVAEKTEGPTLPPVVDQPEDTPTPGPGDKGKGKGK